jgi:hypothetical protein
MVKHEIKVECSATEALREIIEKAYFIEGLAGKIQGKENYMVLTEEMDDVAYSVLKGLHNATVKIINPEIIDGTMRFMIDESNDDLRIYPISIYCIKEDEKYIFY